MVSQNYSLISQEKRGSSMVAKIQALSADPENSVRVGGGGGGVPVNFFLAINIFHRRP